MLRMVHYEPLLPCALTSSTAGSRTRRPRRRPPCHAPRGGRRAASTACAGPTVGACAAPVRDARCYPTSSSIPVCFQEWVGSDRLVCGRPCCCCSPSFCCCCFGCPCRPTDQTKSTHLDPKSRPPVVESGMDAACSPADKAAKGQRRRRPGRHPSAAPGARQQGAPRVHADRASIQPVSLCETESPCTMGWPVYMYLIGERARGRGNGGVGSARKRHRLAPQRSSVSDKSAFCLVAAVHDSAWEIQAGTKTILPCLQRHV
jgi:hypothetical protein